MRKVPVDTNSIVFYKSAQLVGDADDINTWADQELWQRRHTRQWRPKQKKHG
jgi:hypothetical protein